MKSKQLDQWFTIPSTVSLCMEHIDTSPFTSIIDPCAGDKAFGEYVNKMYDIDPKHPDIEPQDFLQLQLPYSSTRLFLTNFPYGSKASLSIKMINHAATMADTIATIVPNTLLRYSAQRHIRDDLRLNLTIDLPKNSFTRDGKVCNVPSQFQIWSKTGECNRVTEPSKSSNKDWVFDNKEPTHYIIGASRRVVSIEDVTGNHRGYKIHSLLDTATLQDRFNSTPWVGSSSVSGGVFWLGKEEISKQYSKHYKLEVHIFQKQQRSYKWLDWDYDMAVARCEANPTVVVGERVTDDRHWILIKGNISKLLHVNWSKYQLDKTTAGISIGDVYDAAT